MNLILMKKFFNIIIIFNEAMSVEIMKLYLKSTVMIKKVLYAAECS